MAARLAAALAWRRRRRRSATSAVELRMVDATIEQTSSSSDDDAKKREIEEFTAPVMRHAAWNFVYWWEPWHIMPYHPSVYKRDAMQVKDEFVAGLTVAFAQVSESIAFAFIAGVGPLLGLHAAWIIGLSLSFFGSPSRHDQWCHRGACCRHCSLREAVRSEPPVLHRLHHLRISDSGRVLEARKVCAHGPTASNDRIRQRPRIILTLGQVFQFEIPCSPPETAMTRPVPTACMANITVNGTSVRNQNVPDSVMIEGSQLGFMFLHAIVVFITLSWFPTSPRSAGTYPLPSVAFSCPPSSSG